MFMVCHKLAPTCIDFFKNQYSGFPHLQVTASDRMSQWFPMNNIRVVLAN